MWCPMERKNIDSFLKSEKIIVLSGSTGGVGVRSVRGSSTILPCEIVKKKRTLGNSYIRPVVA